MRRRRKPGDAIFQIALYVLYGLFTLSCIYPFYYLFINTISSNDLSAGGYINFYPRGIHFDNYSKVLMISGLSHAALVSVYRTVVGTLLTVGSSAFLGYLFTKKEMWGRQIWYRSIVVTMYFSAGLIPWYITMNNLHLTNNYLAYVLPTIITPFNIILVKTFVEAIPASLEESAGIDGAGYLRVFWSIIVPLTTPILATITIFSAVNQWNSFVDTAFLMTDTKYFTLQFLLWRYLNESSSLAALIRSSPDMAASIQNMQTPTSVRMTVTMIVVLPILIVYPFFQRYFVKGIMIGAVKG
ncbi:carbohydrate ABC transporter permease [Paenibacillus sp. HN-1]|uniref:carbohydrate ABC transporter permease n=1 Tax=Paenibacillus TaxID=44249 RepID=UPI001CA7E771|nr:MULTISPECIES: carbohydrate ABC transporter permease [Paenibacillus]MBY9081746.1 carbohydrate ABC transporter permease [Paenibacillus sp. CGMCC 1.18879]MBY9083615.1 carbohydrate ABC transporter permease [Paenibacillus sinensis]